MNKKVYKYDAVVLPVGMVGAKIPYVVPIASFVCRIRLFVEFIFFMACEYIFLCLIDFLRKK